VTVVRKAAQAMGSAHQRVMGLTTLDPFVISIFVSIIIQLVKLMIKLNCPLDQAIDKIQNPGTLWGRRVRKLFRATTTEQAPNRIDELTHLEAAFWATAKTITLEELAGAYRECE